MDALLKISNEFNIPIVEDTCHALQASYKGRRCSSFEITDVLVPSSWKSKRMGRRGDYHHSDESLANRLKLIRNHGLAERNTCLEFAYNSRLDTIQAVIAKHLIEIIFRILHLHDEQTPII